MNQFVWTACWFGLGIAAGALTMSSAKDWLDSREATRRAQRRALLDLPDRPSARRDAQGSARVSTANYVEGKPDSTMQM